MKHIGFFLLLLILTSSRAYALTMSGDFGSLHGKIVNPNLPVPTNTPLVSSTQLPVARNTMQIGYGNPTTTKAIAMSYTKPYIDWEHLSPTEPSIRESNIHLSVGSSRVLSVYAFENHELTASDSGATIPDTTCDDGRCNENVASIWTNQLTYGFGYRCDSTFLICDVGFQQNGYFKQFPSLAQDENPVILLQAHDNASATISYKVNISGTQKKDVYAHEVIFITAPNY